MQVAAVPFRVCSLWPLAFTVSWAVITSPQAAQWEPWVLPAWVQVASVAQSVTTSAWWTEALRPWLVTQLLIGDWQVRKTFPPEPVMRVQPWKASSATLVTVSGTDTFARFTQFRKAFAPMAVTPLESVTCFTFAASQGAGLASLKAGIGPLPVMYSAPSPPSRQVRLPILSLLVASSRPMGLSVMASSEALNTLAAYSS